MMYWNPEAGKEENMRINLTDTYDVLKSSTEVMTLTPIPLFNRYIWCIEIQSPHQYWNSTTHLTDTYDVLKSCCKLDGDMCFQNLTDTYDVLKFVSLLKMESLHRI